MCFWCTQFCLSPFGVLQVPYRKNLKFFRCGLDVLWMWIWLSHIGALLVCTILFKSIRCAFGVHLGYNMYEPLSWTMSQWLMTLHFLNTVYPITIYGYSGKNSTSSWNSHVRLWFCCPWCLLFECLIITVSQESLFELPLKTHELAWQLSFQSCVLRLCAFHIILSALWAN